MDIKDIEKLAELSRISLSSEEKESFLSDFKNILAYVGEIKEVVTEELSREAGEFRNVMREDKEYAEKLCIPEELLSEAPEREGDYIKVKQMFQ
ncbi:MAG: hypothetical protein A2648_01240 [Candidatus Lloydbacteria bacterium RIFCSPHIGHO2_01_FULL_41_20]|uniref:Aspartyl/glutamyl-tRNA(Asn/Gln) amidotransferase subunit C n=1 Tax=Candidatus Lloydbacteria bacterium RIFCSPHIGHO2_01_FULL_41_20 TaxID=1798657 RepID=A0A1G2CS38_9BACT|nr:MAG: hypothetical protein A2648_01240 [Candidatus Lloydbacteria bacterium RIFCSPHIGHO2_01_FULL_41_20]